MKDFTAAELKLIKTAIFTEICRLEEHNPNMETIDTLNRLYEDILAEYKAKKQSESEGR